MFLEELSLSPNFIDVARRYHLGISTDQDQILLEQAHWRRLEGGLNNGVYSIKTPTGKHCFKFYKVDGRQRDQREWAVLQFLSTRGFSYVAQPLFYEKNDQAPLIILEFIEGHHLGSCCLDKVQLALLFERMKEMQAILYDVEVKGLGRLEGRTRMEGMDRFMCSVEPFGQQSKDCLKLWGTWAKSEDPNYICASAPLSFSRMDTSLANCLWDGQHLHFVDLEYAGWTECVFDLAEQVEHDQSRGTPDAAWDGFIKQFDLTIEERKRYLAARRLMAFFWGMKFWPSRDAEISERFTTQVERIRLLCCN